MKKFIMVTLMFALLAGAAFAQGWSVSGQGELGTMLNFIGGGYETIDETKAAIEDGGAALKGNVVPVTWIGSNAYHNIDYYGFIGGNLGIRYNNAGLSTGLDFRSTRSAREIIGVINYSSPNAAFGFEQSANQLLTESVFQPQRLWGYYKFLDGVIHLEAAAKSRDANFWGGSTVLSDLFNGNVLGIDPGEGDYDFDLAFGKGFTDPDKHNYLLVNVAPIDGLEVGLMFPHVFVYGGNAGGGDGGDTQRGTANDNSQAGYQKLQGDNYHVDLVQNVLLHSRLGASYGSGPFRVAFHFAFLGKEQKMQTLVGDHNGDGKVDGDDDPEYVLDKDGNKKEYKKTTVFPVSRKVKGNDGKESDVYDVYTAIPGLYLGASYAINDMISASLGFQGEFYSQKPRLGVALGVDFGMGNLNAGLKLGLHTQIDPSADTPQYYTAKVEGPDTETSIGTLNNKRTYKYWSYSQTKAKEAANFEMVNGTESTFGVRPSVTYKIVENYLAASLDAGLFFDISTFDPTWAEDIFAYEITPQLFFNVAGTGANAGYYSGLNTAIIVRYKIAGTVDGKDMAAYKKQFQPYVDRNSGKAPSGVDVFKQPIYNGLDITFKWAF